MAPRVGLDRDQVFKAAAALVDAKGPDGLSLKALAAKLGIRTPSLYNYVAGLPGLQRELALMGIRMLGTRLTRAGVGKTADEAVVALADAFRAFIKDHPGLYALTLRASRNRRPIDKEMGAAEGEVVAILTVVLSSYGLKDEDALHAARAMRSIVHGFATLELAGGFGLPLNLDESFRRLVQMFVRGLRSPV